jgi:uncharacterized repeat protein (TIGR03803 family)
MTMPSQLLPSILRSFQRTVLPLTMCCVVPVLAARPAQTQTFSVIHAFTGGADGALPYASLTLGGAGTFYGTAAAGGGVIGRNCDPRTGGCGVVFKITQHNGGWILSPLYAFTGFNDGRNPMAPVVFGPGALLYGSTAYAGNNGQCSFEGCGVIFTLQSPPTICRTALCDWTENPIYQFATQTDGREPMGNLAFDQAGNVYGTTLEGGTGMCSLPSTGCGTIFQLTRSGNTWTNTTVYNFLNQSDGAIPESGVIIDSSGVLYGVAAGGAHGDGVVFTLTPSESGWTETVIYSFHNGNDGANPVGGLVMDVEGNLYGTTANGGGGGGGTIFELSPSGGGWTFSLLASLFGIPGAGSRGTLAFDSAGNLYGTTWGNGAHQCGSVFKLTSAVGQWTNTDLHDFTCGDDGGFPEAGVTLDSSGNIYGTAAEYGPPQTCQLGGLGCGVVWEITP